MALPETGSISLGLVRTELKRSDRISLGDTDVRSLASKASGMISLSDLRGKSAGGESHENSVDLTQANIHTLMGSPTEAGDYIFENTATISAASQGGWALQTGVFPAGSTLTIINRGFIRGGGGNGGFGNSSNGQAGGTALVINFPVSVDNTSGGIYGGGGGGAGGGYGGGGGGAGMVAGAAGGSTFAEFRGTAGTATAGGKPGSATSAGGGYGGGLGAAGSLSAGAGGGAGRGGYSVQTNGNTITWIAVGDRRGSVV